MVDLIQKVPVLGAAEREGTGARSSVAAAHLSSFMTALDPDETAGVPAERRVYFEVFGCQMNKLDAELMMSVLFEDGYRLTNRPEDAGVILYNTCAVREQAENRVFSKIGALKPLKKRKPGVVLGVLGCSAQNHREEIFRKHPHVGIVCGPGEFLRLPELIDRARKDGRVAALDLERQVSFKRTRNLGPSPFQAFISVMRGCDQACTFCIVPRTRGKEVSRPVIEIVDEARRLVDSGVREITLLGQTVNSYGKRLAKQRKIGLHHVLHELNKIRGLERISFITSHPRFMFPELIDAMADLEKVTEYLHLPVQSGSDSVLERMLRTYTIDEYRRVVDAIRERIPDIGLATDIIVGFCGESDEEFEATARLLHEMAYQGAFIFKYSERAETRAASVYADDVPDDVKKERNQRALKIVEKHARGIYAERIGQVEEVLVEGPSKLDRARLTGRNRRHQIVVFPGDLDDGLVGRLVPVRITGATNVVLVGERVTAASRTLPDESERVLTRPE